MIDFTGVKVLLAKRHMTQKQLAERTGVRYDTISKISLGTISRIPVDVLDKICTALSCQPGDLMEHTKKIPLPAAKNCREGDNFLTCLQLACNLLVAAQKAKKASRNYFYFGNGSQSACRQLARSVQFA